MIYFTADTHFFHANIIRLSNRPFADIDEMHAALIANWNAVVRESDDIYILGDFAFKGSVEHVNEILSKLNGNKYLVKGNHDDKKYLNDPNFVSAFEWIKDYHELSYKDARLILFHYPILEWAHYYRKSAHLYGHVHNSNFHHPESRAINAGVDVNSFFPVSAESVYTQAFADRRV